MHGMRSIVALALLARALALPAMTPSTTLTNDDSPALVQLSVARALCDKLARMGSRDDECTNLQVLHVVDLCNASDDSSTDQDPRSVPTLLKLALGGLKNSDSGSGDDKDNIRPLLKLALGLIGRNGESNGGDNANALRPLLKLALGRMNGADDSDSNATRGLLKLALGRLGGDEQGDSDSDSELRGLLANIKLELAKPGQDGDSHAALLKIVNDIIDCDKDNSSSGSLAATLTAAVSAAATQTLNARDIDMLAATRLASLKLAATHTASSAETSSTDGYSRSSSKYGALDLDEVMTGSKKGEKYDTSNEDENDMPVF